MSIPAFESYAQYKKNFEAYHTAVDSAPPANDPSPAPMTSHSLLVLPAGLGMVIGYLATNVMLISDIYCGGLPIEGKVAPSPISMWHLSAMELTLFYVVCSLLTVACAVVVTCRTMPPHGAILLMCPLVLAFNVAGKLMRDTGFLARYCACVFLFGGVCLTGIASLYFMNTPSPLPVPGSDPMLYSISLHAGLTLVIASILALRKE